MIRYQDAGVSIDAGNELVNEIKKVVKSTYSPHVLAGVGGFSALFEVPKQYKEPILVSGTDGVGTKLKLALELKKHDTIGIDLVAMCVNDVIVCGAKPLFFLDYYATGKLDVKVAADVIKGIAEGCKQSGAALIGGETAEMPGMYHNDDYDLAGFCVGIVEKEKIIDGRHVKAGDILLGLASSGPHSNGYSLIRKVLDVAKIPFSKESLLTPTRIYVKCILELQQKVPVKALAHITGGGLLENIPRVLPAYTTAHLNTKGWSLPAVFQWLQKEAELDQTELFRTFNCGIGMVVCVASQDAKAAKDILQQSGETVFEIGKIEKSASEAPHVTLV